jgi:hypothetical protein
MCRLSVLLVVHALTTPDVTLRLEREENERLEAEKKVELLEMKKQLEAQREKVKDQGGVVYKGECTRPKATTCY